MVTVAACHFVVNAEEIYTDDNCHGLATKRDI
jgi:hypothetical protein